MAIIYQKSNPHWNYFIALEDDFEVVSRYIEPCTQNEDAFSLELARLIMAATQEVDVVMKALCQLLSPQSNAEKIGEYQNVISNNCSSFLTEQVRIPRFGMSSEPWKGWGANPPFWWTANNKIKHERSKEFHQATLKNTYNAIAGLLIATLHLQKQQLSPNPKLKNDWWRVTTPLDPKPRLFRMDDAYFMKIGAIGYEEYL